MCVKLLNSTTDQGYRMKDKHNNDIVLCSTDMVIRVYNSVMQPPL